MARQTGYIACIALVSLCVAACNKRVPWTGDSAGVAKSETYQGAEKEIKNLDNGDWTSPKDYESLRKVKIGEATSLGETDRLALEEGLNKTYADQLVRTQAHILDSECGPRHTTLYAARREYAAHARDFGAYIPAGKDAVDTRFDEHEEMMKFSVSSAYDAPLSSCLSPYDSSYDSQKRAEAARLRAKNPNCSVIRQKISETNVNRILAARKQNYYSRLASKFCSEPDPAYATYQSLLGILAGAGNYAELRARVENHWERCQNK